MLVGAVSVLCACHRDAPSTANRAPRDQTAVGAEKPTRWLPPRRRCHRYRDRGFCDGPRRVPEPHGAAKRRAERLRLGTRRAANRILAGKPLPRWVSAVEGSPQRTLLWPVPGGKLVRGFGYVRRSQPDKRHDGVDIHAEPGTPVRCANDGIVAYSDNGVRGMGNLVAIVHADGTATLYAHLRAAYVFAGQHAARGQVIGELGNTGLSRGPHLHFEWRRAGRPRNPIGRFVGRE